MLQGPGSELETGTKSTYLATVAEVVVSRFRILWNISLDFVLDSIPVVQYPLPTGQHVAPAGQQ